MALKVLNAGSTRPLGQFDGLDAQALVLKGGEIVTFSSVVATSATDKGSADVFDGYANPNKRTVVTNTISATTSPRPLMLADEGIAGYGTLFGTVVGGTVGQVVSGGATLGPSTATGSGKVTCWAEPGLYGVTLDNVDTTASTGLVPTNATLVAGAALYCTVAGLLSPNATGSAGGGSLNNGPPVGRFVEFQTNGSLVTTGANMVGTLNAPDGTYSAASRTFAHAVFWFNPPTT